MTKDRILEVASQEFAKYGYDAVSMNNLVKKLDINKATVYYHYKDKKALYNEVIKALVEFRNEKTRLIFKDNSDGKSLLKAYINVEVNAIKERPYMVPLALREIANLGADLDDSIVPLFEEDIRYIQMILDKLELKDEYKEISVYAFFSLMMGTFLNFYSIQMSDLAIGTKDELKKDGEKSLDYISEFLYNIIVSSTCK